LLLATLMLPDQAGPAVRRLAGHALDAHVALAIWSWGSLLRRKRSKENSSGVADSFSARPDKSKAGYVASARRVECLPQHDHSSSSPSGVKTGDSDKKHRLRRSGAIAASGRCLSAAGAAAVGLALKLSMAAALLTGGGAAWALLHPSSHHIAGAAAALMAVLVESKQLQRQAATGRFSRGRCFSPPWSCQDIDGEVPLLKICMFYGSRLPECLEGLKC
jgi:hypothetical protein